MPFKQRGQGAAEVIVALPAFLILVCVISQLFLLGIAKAQLQYAAFCAARVGSVRAGDKDAMRQAVSRILAISPGDYSSLDEIIKVKIIESDNRSENKKEMPSQIEDKNIRVRIHWKYPLIVPLADSLIPGNQKRTTTGKPCVHLQASWAMAMFDPISRKNKNDSNRYN
jgi:hypothetical protein